MAKKKKKESGAGELLAPENLARLKGALTKKYEDETLQDTAFLFTSTPLFGAGVLGLADATEQTLFLVANISIPILAEYINAGILNPDAVAKYVKELKGLSEQQQIQRAKETVNRTAG